MRSFYAAYGTVLLLVSLAFTYFESFSKDQRILKAKIAHAHQLAKEEKCQKAFELLTQHDQPMLKDYYQPRSLQSLKTLRQSLCEALENTSKLEGNFQTRKEGNDNSDLYRIELPVESSQAPVELKFKRVQGELLLTEVN